MITNDQLTTWAMGSCEGWGREPVCALPTEAVPTQKSRITIMWLFLSLAANSKLKHFMGQRCAVRALCLWAAQEWANFVCTGPGGEHFSLCGINSFSQLVSPIFVGGKYWVWYTAASWEATVRVSLPPFFFSSHRLAFVPFFSNFLVLLEGPGTRRWHSCLHDSQSPGKLHWECYPFLMNLLKRNFSCLCSVCCHWENADSFFRPQRQPRTLQVKMVWDPVPGKKGLIAAGPVPCECALEGRVWPPEGASGVLLPFLAGNTDS